MANAINDERFNAIFNQAQNQSNGLTPRYRNEKVVWHPFNAFLNRNGINAEDLKFKKFTRRASENSSRNVNEDGNVTDICVVHDKFINIKDRFICPNVVVDRIRISDTDIANGGVKNSILNEPDKWLVSANSDGFYQLKKDTSEDITDTDF